MPKIDPIPSFNGGYATNTKLNQSFNTVKDALENTISRDGSGPNEMNADLDMNGYSLLNIDSIAVNDIKVNGENLGIQEALEEMNELYDDIATELAGVPKTRGNWQPATAYLKDDLVFETTSGNSYYALVDHTSSAAFATDSANWQLFARAGASGSGTGDMIGANNLSELTDPATARSNLGLGALATKSTVGSSDIVDSSVSTSKIGNSQVTFQKIASAAVETSANPLTSSDTTIPTSGAVKNYVDNALPGRILAWANFDGTGTVAIRASGNVSSITDNGTGDYTINFAQPLPNANYACICSAGKMTNDSYTYWAEELPLGVGIRSTNAVQIRTGYVSGTGAGGYRNFQDLNNISVLIIG